MNNEIPNSIKFLFVILAISLFLSMLASNIDILPL